MLPTPAIFLLHFDDHKANGLVWEIQTGGKSHFAASVSVHVPMFSNYEGPTAPQPRAYFQGIGVIHWIGTHASIQET